MLEGFSQRPRSSDADLGRQLLDALLDAAGGDPLLRGGHPAAETLLLLAIKSHDYERHCLPALRRARTVIEGRSLHSVAVYQSLILHPNDDLAAHNEAHAILNLAAQWRPLPDLTILVTDHAEAALERAEHRDHKRSTTQLRRLHHRAAALFDQLAADDPAHVLTVDRRTTTADEVITVMLTAIHAHKPCPPRLAEPWRHDIPHSLGGQRHRPVAAD